MNTRSGRELAIVTEVVEPGRGDAPAFDEPYLSMYHELVGKMEKEASVLPGMQTAVGLLIRNLARDYVVRVIADHGGGEVARAAERDRRMMTTFKMLLDQAARADLEHALRTEFVLGLITELVKILDAEVGDRELRIRLKELMRGAFVTYTESVQGKISR